MDRILTGAGILRLRKKTGLSKSTLYRMCEPDANPTLENIGRVLSYVNRIAEIEAA
jgi:DNA-binding phage protein